MGINMLPMTMKCEDCGGDRFEVIKEEVKMGAAQVRVSCQTCSWTVVLPVKDTVIVKCAECSVAHVVRGYAA
jgi:hypothetical protein